MPLNVKQSESDFKLNIEVALIKKDIQNLQEDVSDIKEEISGIKGWAVKAFWVVLTAILIQVTNFVLSGGLNAFK